MARQKTEPKQWTPDRIMKVTVTGLITTRKWLDLSKAKTSASGSASIQKFAQRFLVKLRRQADRIVGVPRTESSDGDEEEVKNPSFGLRQRERLLGTAAG